MSKLQMDAALVGKINTNGSAKLARVPKKPKNTFAEDLPFSHLFFDIGEQKTVTENETPKTSLWEQNAKIIGLVLGLCALFTGVYTVGATFARMTYQLETMQKDIEALKQKNEKEQDLKFQEAIQNAKVAGFQLGAAETKQEKK
jgi:hypothetical protein